MNRLNKLIKNKLGLPELAQVLTELAHPEIPYQKPTARKRVDADTIKAVLSMGINHPDYGQSRVSEELRKQGIFISECGVRNIWIRNEMETCGKRLRALFLKIEKEGMALTDAQISAIEKIAKEKQNYMEMQIHAPGDLGTQDTYYVGSFEALGDIYQQTFIDVYSRVVFAKLYNCKTALTAVDLLNDQVIPFLEEHQVPLIRILTDRGVEYCGTKRYHEYKLYLSVENIKHLEIRTKNTQENHICEHFHQLLQSEFYDVAFRKGDYQSIEQLQEDLDQWLNNYNTQRLHYEKYYSGKTPMNIFRIANLICAKEKCLEQQKIAKMQTVGECVISSAS